MNDIITIDSVKYQRVEVEVKQPTAKYKVGDWVRVIANNAKRSYDHAYVGIVAKIMWVYDHGEYKREVNNELIPAYSIYKSFVVYEDELEPAEEPKQDPFDIAEGEWYYNICGNGVVGAYIYEDDDTDNERIRVANLCKDKTLTEQRALHEILNRLLWRASIQAGELDNPWDGCRRHYVIAYNLKSQEFIIDYYGRTNINASYFPSKESAQNAIDNIVMPFIAEHPDFVW